MKIQIYKNAAELGMEAASQAAELIRATLAQKEQASIILATGASQFETLKNLTAAKGIDWGRVVMFHLDEYLGLDASHRASFRRYLTERFIQMVPGLKAAYLVDGQAADPQRECERLGKLIAQHPIDVALVGIGENGHLAFNDPPADFQTGKAYLVVDLDEACRRQQVNEGWFAGLNDVPRQAISMGIRQIMKSRTLIVSVPGAQKAAAVHGAIDGPVANTCPASIMQQHSDCRMFLDEASAARLDKGH